MTDSIIFDLDGTLWDSTDGGAVVWSKVAEKYNVVAEVTADRLKQLYGLPVEEIALRLFPDTPRDIVLTIMKESCEMQCPYLEKEGGILFPNMIETLQVLKKKYRLFIVSNCEEGYIQSFLKAYELGAYFEDFEYPGRTGLPKADNIRMIIDRNQLEDPIYVGDTSGDATASKKAGIPFVYARYGFGQVEEYDFAIDSLEELLQISS